MQKVTPFLWFDGNIAAAVKFYCSVFAQAKVISVSGSGKNVRSATLRLGGQELMLFNGGSHYKLTPAFSLFVRCRDQKEIDYYWNRLTKGGEASQCGWLKDRFGLSWQIIPDGLGELLGDSDKQKAGRALQAMLRMGKLDLKTLQQAHGGIK